MNIAFLGASSQIAKGLIKQFSKNTQNHLTLFIRDYEKFSKWLMAQKISKDNFTIKQYTEFSVHDQIDVIINCVGVGDPAKALKMTSSIKSITRHFDEIALQYLYLNPKTKYFFLSSGIAYGNIFSSPARSYAQQNIDVYSTRPEDAYAISKVDAEKIHRNLKELSIIDIRIFSYLSDDLDINSKFLISDALRAIKNSEILYTNHKNITRDYISPYDLFQLIIKFIDIASINTVVDAYSREPIDKISLLNFLNENFGLHYEFRDSFEALNATGSKDNYYSKNFCAESYGFKPKFSSKDIIKEVAIKLLDN